MTKTKEQVYDEKIEPLMGEILNICRANGIAMAASFDISRPVMPQLYVSSALSDENKEVSGLIRELQVVIRRSLSGSTIIGGTVDPE